MVQQPVGHWPIYARKLREEIDVEQTPSSGKDLEDLVDRARRMALRYAQVSPYNLHPTPDVWGGITRAIGRQAKTFHWPYCP